MKLGFGLYKHMLDDAHTGLSGAKPFLLDLYDSTSNLKANKFDGVLIPDHTPLMSCATPWHGGMAFSMGYMKALLWLPSLISKTIFALFREQFLRTFS